MLPSVEAPVNGLPVAGAEYHTCDPLADGFLADGVTPACANITAATCRMPGMSANERGVLTEQSNMLCFCSEHNGGVDLHDNFWTAIAFAAFITWILKMCAIFLEKTIGIHCRRVRTAKSSSCPTMPARMHRQPSAV